MDLATIKKGFRSLPKLENKKEIVVSIDNLIDDSYSILQTECLQDRAKFDFDILSEINSHKATSHEEIEDFIVDIKDVFELGKEDEITILTTNPIYKGINGTICPIEKYFNDENPTPAYADILKLRHAIACASIQSYKSNIDIHEFRLNFFESKTFEQLKGCSRNLLATWLYFRNE